MLERPDWMDKRRHVELMGVMDDMLAPVKFRDVDEDELELILDAIRAWNIEPRDKK